MSKGPRKKEKINEIDIMDQYDHMNYVDGQDFNIKPSNKNTRKKKINPKELDELDQLHNMTKNICIINPNIFETNDKIKSNTSSPKSIDLHQNTNKQIDSKKIEPNSTESNKSNQSNISTEDNLMTNVVTLKDFKSKELMHYKKLDNFFNNSNIEECQMMVDIINGNHLISLRFLDWFVTRYCYLYKLAINVDNKYIKQKDFNINISYKAQLKSFKKKYFDPFRRKKKFFYVCEKNNLVILTTLGQLNFFRWALSYDIIKYTEVNYRDIISKLSHVNSYFKKHVIENNSHSTTDKSDDKSNNSDNNSNEHSNDHSNDSSNDKSNTDSSSGPKNINKTKSSIGIVGFKKDKKAKFKNPVVSRNIFLEL